MGWITVHGRHVFIDDDVMNDSKSKDEAIQKALAKDVDKKDAELERLQKSMGNPMSDSLNLKRKQKNCPTDVQSTQTAMGIVPA